MAPVYVPRSPTTGVLYGVVRAHLAEFLAAVDAETDGSGVPALRGSGPALPHGFRHLHPGKADISTLERSGHFYFVLTAPHPPRGAGRIMPKR